MTRYRILRLTVRAVSLARRCVCGACYGFAVATVGLSGVLTNGVLWIVTGIVGAVCLVASRE